MQIIVHRINTIERLKKIPSRYGVEIDVRGFGEKMFLTHDPVNDIDKYDELETYLKNFNHAFIIFNVKETGYEQRIIDLAKKYNIKNYFFLDVEFPYLYQATRKNGVKKIAVRYSEVEPIECIEAQIVNGQPLVDWVWIDTITTLPLDKNILNRIKLFKTCLVCPERWGRPQDIELYIEKMRYIGFKPTAVMTDERYIDKWEKF